MKKIDLNISRSMTIALPNFKSIKPSVSITIKDVDTEKIKEAYDDVSELLDVLYGLELITLMNEYESLNSQGINKYIEEYREVKDKMLQKLENWNKSDDKHC